jgi:parvulin-like peptidyl-prolyl isomerase
MEERFSMVHNRPLTIRTALLAGMMTAGMMLNPVLAPGQYGPPPTNVNIVSAFPTKSTGPAATLNSNENVLNTVRQNSPDNWSEFEPARILARVGEDVILAGDILGLVDQQLAPYREKLPEAQFNEQRSLLLRRQLKTIIEMKILYQAFIRKIPQKRRKDALANVWEQINQRFLDEELPAVMKKAEVNSIKELDDQLREFGWSIAKQTRLYGERQLGIYGLFQDIERKPHVAHVELVRAYRDGRDSYHVAAKARFEKLTVRFDRFDSEQDAHLAIIRMGDQVVIGGAPFWAVAKRSSHGINADDGGKYDWTTRGSLASDVIDKTIFSIPVERMSQILRDERGFHIVRVLEREDEHYISFAEAQAAIRKKIQGQKREKAFEKYVARAHDQVSVWTIYDDTVTR